MADFSDRTDVASLSHKWSVDKSVGLVNDLYAHSRGGYSRIIFVQNLVVRTHSAYGND